ncbi:M48 metallopeptidase family protein [Streptacidiphilus neutrinimicus]|uniref:M48 metallopeptidase family protein n=1 Tax=Streptacidiphilus neutrinimicus TaxID=105420 RepID=UPI001F180093|nr:M48 family metallopeptidase [Streptacidiphilus neutrinimicus]
MDELRRPASPVKFDRPHQRWLPPRVSRWSALLAAPTAPLQVRSLGYRWGSCSERGALNLHWAVMQLPPILIDYVLVHELAHLHVPNHSPEFWRCVARGLPDFEARRSDLEGWGASIWLPEHTD